MSSGQLLMKKEKISSSLTLEKSYFDLTMKSPGSRNRKNSEATDLSLEYLGAEDTLQKQVSFCQAISVSVNIVSYALHFTIFNGILVSCL